MIEEPKFRESDSNELYLLKVFQTADIRDYNEFYSKIPGHIDILTRIIKQEKYIKELEEKERKLRDLYMFC